MCFNTTANLSIRCGQLFPCPPSGFLPLVIGTPDRILRFLPWLFGGIWLLLRGAWTLTRYLNDHPHAQVMEQMPKMNDRIREWNQRDRAGHEPARLAILYSAGEAGFV